MRRISSSLCIILGTVACPSLPGDESASSTEVGSETTAMIPATGDVPTLGMGDETSPTPTTGTACTADDFEVLGQCYHQTELPEIAVAIEVAAGDFDGDQSLDLAMMCRVANGGTEPSSLCVTTLDGSTVLRKE